MRRFAALAAGAAAVVALGLCTAPSANAHATLVSSTPVDGARVEVAPAEVTLTFEEPVQLVPGTAQVISDDGARADSGDAHLSTDGATLVIPLRPDVEKGSYSAVWRVISADTHTVSGSISFGVGQAAHEPPPQTVDPSHVLTVTDDVVQGFVYLGVILSLGLTFVCATLWRWALSLARIRALIWAGWALIGCATFAQFLIEGPRALGVGWAEIFAGSAVSEALHDRTGAVLMVRTVALLLMAAVTRRIIKRSNAIPAEPDRTGIAMLVTGAAAVAVSVAARGHAATGRDLWLAIPVTALHLLAMAVWVGGLITLVLAVLPQRRTENLRRWSQTALSCVSVLVVTGGYQAWRQVYPVGALWSTRYGITLLVKLALVIGMLTLGYLARRRLTPERLRRTVPIEAALGVAVIVITTVLTAQPPARDTYGPSLSAVAPLGSRSAEIHVSSTRHGPTEIEVTPRGPAGGPAGANAVKGTLSSNDAGIAALPVTFSPIQGGSWRSTYAVVPRAGWWTLTVTVEFSIKEAVVTSTRFRVW